MNGPETAHGPCGGPERRRDCASGGDCARPPSAACPAALLFGTAENTSRPGGRGVWAAAGKVDITPDLKTESIWLAGYGAKGRRPEGVHDPLHARALVVSDGEKTAALVAVDVLGVFREETEAIRRLLGWTGEKRYLFIAATHTHSGPDTVGLWGPLPGVSGVDKRYRKRVREAVVSLIKDLSGRLERVELRAASAKVDPRGLCRDSRDPAVLDDELNALQVLALPGPGSKERRVLGTVVRWSCHPEVLGSKNRRVSADYAGELCSRVEERTGGACVFFSGSIGGLMTPDTDDSGGVEGQYREMRRVGEALADKALAALRADRGPAAARGDRALKAGAAGGPLDFDSRVVRVPVENSRYLLFLPSLAFGHRILDQDGRPLGRRRVLSIPLRHLLFFPLPEKARPWVETEVSRLRLGPVDILGIPGELFPELAVGGFDGSRSFGHPFIKPGNANPPAVERAPKGPYLRERLGRHGWVVGLANDELGYLVPSYDFQVAPTRSMTPKPAGTHYEETNSIGPSATRIVLDAADELLRN